MEDSLRLLVFLCLLFWGRVFAQSTTQPHQSGGEEHIVLIDTSHPTPPHVDEVLQRLSLSANHSDVKYIYNNTHFKGFSASMKNHCLDLLANMSDVSSVEKAVTVARAAPIVKRQSQAYSTRKSAPWGLQQISTAGDVTGDPKAMDYTYGFANGDLGKGVDIYIIDTGIYTQHNVFTGRATLAWSADNSTTDQDGHGTHVSGTAAGAILGVASNANLHGIKVLSADGKGSSSAVIAGIDFVISRHQAQLQSNSSSSYKGAIISMSLASGSPVPAIDTALQAAIRSGIHACVAAGNDNQDACKSSPAASGGQSGSAITVGSVGMTLQRSTFSNFGSCVDVYGPGENVVSAWIGAPNMVNVLSGTSMATPHVTGIVAYAMANSTLAKNPGLMKEWVVMGAGKGVGDGVLVVNNGVRQQQAVGASSVGDGEEKGTKDGMLGFSKIGVSAASESEGEGFQMASGVKARAAAMRFK